MRLKPDEVLYCKRCGVSSLPDVVDAPPPHEKKVICPECGYCHGFLAKEKNEQKLDHRPNGQPTPSQLADTKGIDFCEICLRRKDQLGKKGFFEVHHISRTPSDNSTGNLLHVCKACHSFIHHLQTYLNDHLKEFYGEQ